MFYFNVPYPDDAQACEPRGSDSQERGLPQYDDSHDNYDFSHLAHVRNENQPLCYSRGLGFLSGYDLEFDPHSSCVFLNEY
jgi:hypothetical protein